MAFLPHGHDALATADICPFDVSGILENVEVSPAGVASAS
jgi:hypothetical protein